MKIIIIIYSESYLGNLNVEFLKVVGVIGFFRRDLYFGYEVRVLW